MYFMSVCAPHPALQAAVCQGVDMDEIWQPTEALLIELRHAAERKSESRNKLIDNGRRQSGEITAIEMIKMQK